MISTFMAILAVACMWSAAEAFEQRSLQMKVDVAVFDKHLLRVHDNPVLRRSKEDGRKVIPLYITDLPDGSVEVENLERRLGSKVWAVSSARQVHEFLSNVASQHASDLQGDIRVVHYREIPKALEEGMKQGDVKVSSVLEVDDFLHDAELMGQDIDAMVLDNPVFSAMKGKLYGNAALSKGVPLPDMAMKGFKFCEEVSASSGVAEDDEELRALNLMRDYLLLGEYEFTEKYAQEYIATKALSYSHKKSLDRLVPRSTTGGSTEYSNINLFYGEVCSGLISEACNRGLISPRLLLKARDSSIAGKGLWEASREEILAIDRPFKCQLREDVTRRDWQRRVERASRSMCKDGVSPVGYIEKFNVAAGGYLERTGVMPASSATGSSGDSPPSTSLPPLAVLVHGFGGSMDQMAGLSKELSQRGFEVFGVDLIGFGRSEKPPISYNQYFWRDQVILAVMRHQKESCDGQEREVVFFGNSIGGFTAASAAAAFAEPIITDTANIVRYGAGVKVAGLVLFNSAGRILADPNASNSSTDQVSSDQNKGTKTSKPTLTVEEEMDFISDKYKAKFYPPYSGPPGPLLRLFGSGLIAALQPQIRKTTEWLYPSQPQVIAESALDKSILRDSLDPGARDVMASGAKLPAPVSIDALLQCYKGPVLIAQGALDPLNDAVDRAGKFGAIREGVQVELMQLGHCPMDEDPKQCAEVVLKWWKESKTTTDAPVITSDTDAGRASTDLEMASV